MSDSITSANPSVEESISLYENLLKTSPNDSAALEALASAYEKAGNTLRARATLIRLSRVLITKRDIVAAARVVEMLRPHAEADFDALEALTSLEILVKESPDLAAADEGAQPRRAGAEEACRAAAAPRLLVERRPHGACGAAYRQ